MDLTKEILEILNSDVKEYEGNAKVLALFSDRFKDKAKELNALFNLHLVSSNEVKLPRWTNNDVDASYLMGCINVGGIDAISKELKRLKRTWVETTRSC